MKEQSRGGRMMIRQNKNKDQDAAIEDSKMDIWQYARQDVAARVEALVTSGGVDVDERNDKGETPLHVAAAAGSDAVVQVLLSHGADLRLSDWESGWTALHRSVYFEHLTTTLLLLRCARRLHGRKFMNEYLYDTRDHNRESPMEMISLRTSQVNDEDSQRRRGGMVYTFGKVDFQLGYHLPHVNVQSSPRLVELPVTQPIVQISASKFHTVALNASGEAFAWGFGKGGRLGTGTEFNHVEPTRLSSLAEIPIARVAAGENHTLALSRSGQVFSWGSNSFGQLGHQLKSCSHESRLTPKRIDAFRGMTITDIAASGCHSGAVCIDDGSVYTWGLNKRGQLGRKDGFGSDQPNPTPRRVDRLVPGHALSVIYEAYDSITVKTVAMSDVHTCVVLRCSGNGQSTGQVWQFGYGSNIPTRINFKEKRRRTGSHLMIDSWLPRHKMLEMDIVSVSCAPNHSIALSACGSVFTWGHNGDALSHELLDENKPGKEFIPPGAPQRVALDEYAPVVSVCASQNHCAVVTRDGNLVSWGTGPQGVLGHGPGRSWQPKPKQVTGAKKVTAVAAGHQHTVLLVSPQLPDPPSDRESVSPPKLRHLLEHRIADLMDLSNAATVWKYANVYSQTKLERSCVDYMKLNWDALLEMGGKERLDSLFDLMLPEESPIIGHREPKDATPRSSRALSASSVPGASSTSSASTVPVTTRQRSLPIPPVDSVTATIVASPQLPTPDPSSKSVDDPAKPRVGSTQRKKTPKFVPLDAYLQSSASGSKPRATNELSHSNPLEINPWKGVGKESAPPQAPPSVDSVTAQPVAKSFRPPRKESVDLLLKKATAPSSASSGNGWMSSPHLTGSASPMLSSTAVKQVLCEDGSERLTQSTFTLEAFVKKSARKKKRSDSTDVALEQSSTWSAPVVQQQARAKTLREIQAEEEARAAAEAAAKARHGGFVRKSSTLNSWGLVEQLGHVSLAELQRREEEERFLDEQRQILAQIQEENRLRQLQERGATKKKAPSKRASSVKQSDKTPKEEQKPNSSTRRTGDKRGAQVATSDTTATSSRRGKKKSAPSTGESKSRATDNGADGLGQTDVPSRSRAQRPRKSVQAA
ncbi:hypothetical protein PINS_up012046 [Pythium insidiosum]|nr:hypothetical protein PINS_up012046 [Pythium insidiosum]